MRRILVPRRKRVRRHVSAAKSLRKFAAARFPFDFSSRCEQRESLSIEIRPFHPKNPMPYIYIYTVGLEEEEEEDCLGRNS